jgi:hypothetical protein
MKCFPTSRKILSIFFQQYTACLCNKRSVFQLILIFFYHRSTNLSPQLSVAYRNQQRNFIWFISTQDIEISQNTVCISSGGSQFAFAVRCDSHPLGLGYPTNNNLLSGEPAHAIIPLCSRYYDNYTAAPGSR